MYLRLELYQLVILCAVVGPCVINGITRAFSKRA